MMEYTIRRASSEELYHFGIKGQKWGIRRFENEDGTLTEAGKKRYARAEKTAAKEKITGEQMKKNAFRRGAVGAAVGSAVGGIKAVNDSVNFMNKNFDKKFIEVPRDLYDAHSLGKFGYPGMETHRTSGGFFYPGSKAESSGYDITSFKLPQIDMSSPSSISNVAKFTSTIMNGPGKIIAGGVIGAGVGTLGSLTVDALHNARIDKARKFVDKYSAAYKKTMEKENDSVAK